MPLTVKRQTLPAWLVLPLALALAGCGGAGSERKASGQIAATVNDGEVTVHQLQVVMERQPRGASGDGSAASRALEGLIDQELAAQAARSASLDKDPRVVQRLEAARREILAQAWQESVAAQARTASSDEIDRYHDEHPALFAQRRLYVLQETGVEADPATLSQLQEQVAATKSADELARTLQRAGLSGATRVLAQAAEDLPFGLLERLSTLEPGRSAAFVQGGASRIYTVLHVQQAPVDRRQARGAIAAFLANQRKGEVVAESMKKLRSEARIAYQGSFAAPVPAPAASRP